MSKTGTRIWDRRAAAGSSSPKSFDKSAPEAQRARAPAEHVFSRARDAEPPAADPSAPDRDAPPPPQRATAATTESSSSSSDTESSLPRSARVLPAAKMAHNDRAEAAPEVDATMPSSRRGILRCIGTEAPPEAPHPGTTEPKAEAAWLGGPENEAQAVSSRSRPSNARFLNTCGGHLRARVMKDIRSR